MTTPPVSPAREVVETIHGVEVRDPYRWLEDSAAPEVAAWVRAQQAHARSVLDADPHRAEIARRMTQTLAVGVMGTLHPRGRYRFFTRRTGDMNQAALYLLEPDGSERVLVDPGPLSPDGTTALDWWYPSPGGEMVALGISERGDEDSDLCLVDTASGRMLPDRIPRCRLASVAFEPDGRALLYSQHPAPGSVPAGEEHYNRHVYRHLIGTDSAQDVKVFGEGRDKLDFPGLIGFSADRRWTVLTVMQGWSRTAVFLRDGAGEFVPIFEGVDKEVYPYFAGDRLLARTNLEAPNYRLVEIDPLRPSADAWRTIVAESDHPLEDFAVARGGLLVHLLADACSVLHLHGLDGRFARDLAIPPLSTVTGLGAHHDLAAAYVTLEGFTRPATTYEVAADGGLRKVAELPHPIGVDSERHPVRQVFVESADGTPVPMFLVGRPSGRGPTVLTGYGGFNLARTPLWSPTVLPFLEAGGLYCVAGLRGGGEYGERWHRAGMLGNKQNVFDDFIAAAEWLISAGLAEPRTLGILGGSNGGLLVGAAMTQRPELFGAVVCRVPLLDMVRYEGFKVAQIWAAEYGSAADPEAFGWLFAYSPYHHLADGVRYPPVLFTSGEEDTRVDPMHARKMAARTQAAAPQGEVLLRVEPRAGHGMGKPVTKIIPEEADIWSFLLSRLGP